MKLFEINGVKVSIERAQYSNKRIALLLKDLAGMVYTKLTVNLVDEEVEADEMVIDANNPLKLYQWALNHNICSEADRCILSGPGIYPVIVYPVVKLLPPDTWTGWKEYSNEEAEELFREYMKEEYNI